MNNFGEKCGPYLRKRGYFWTERFVLMGRFYFVHQVPATLLLGFGLFSSALWAHPAVPDGVYSMKNGDGSVVKIRFHGDEHYRVATTEDGYVVVQDSGSYHYIDNDGNISREIARDVEHRSKHQKKFLEGIQKDVSRAAHKKRSRIRYVESLEAGVPFRHAPSYDISSSNVEASSGSEYIPVPRKRASGESWAVGERWIPVLLMGASDKPFADSAAIYALLNQEGYSKDGNIGSLRDYYLHSSNGKFNPHFDVYPVNVGKTLTAYTYQGTDYYGNYGTRFNEGRFIADAIDLVTARADFKSRGTKYCVSGSAVDGFIALFPGKEEDALKISEDFWGHQYWLQYNVGSYENKGYAKNGYTFNKYLFIAQKADNMFGGESKLNIMGVYAHEFSHVLGLSDHYNLNTGSGGPVPYDVMTQGMYNAKGNTPPAFSGFERETMGWLTLKELNPGDTISLKSLSQGEAYSITNPNHRDEYYVVEYRPPEKYDAYIGENGIYVWYIDYDYTAFVTNNNPNGDDSHLRVDISTVVKSGMSAENFKYVNKSGVAKVPGIYSTVMDGNTRACFTTGKDLSIDQCPDEEVLEVSSSSEEVVESSSSEIFEESSSSSDPEIVEVSSSSTLGITETAGLAPGIRMSISAGILEMTLPAEGTVQVKIFDLQGNRVYDHRVDGSRVTIDVGKLLPVGSYVLFARGSNGLYETRRFINGENRFWIERKLHRSK